MFQNPLWQSYIKLHLTSLYLSSHVSQPTLAVLHQVTSYITLPLIPCFTTHFGSLTSSYILHHFTSHPMFHNPLWQSYIKLHLTSLYLSSHVSQPTLAVLHQITSYITLPLIPCFTTHFGSLTSNYILHHFTSHPMFYNPIWQSYIKLHLTSLYLSSHVSQPTLAVLHQLHLTSLYLSSHVSQPTLAVLHQVTSYITLPLIPCFTTHFGSLTSSYILHHFTSHPMFHNPLWQSYIKLHLTSLYLSSHVSQPTLAVLHQITSYITLPLIPCFTTQFGSLTSNYILHHFTSHPMFHNQLWQSYIKQSFLHVFGASILNYPRSGDTLSGLIAACMPFPNVNFISKCLHLCYSCRLSVLQTNESLALQA